MAYHDLSTCTLNEDERRAEADRIIEMLDPLDESRFTERELDFFRHIGVGAVSVKQLFWLRDIKDKYL